MSTLADRSLSISKVAAAVAACLLCAPIAQAQAPAGAASHAATSASRRGPAALMRRDLIGAPGKEAVVSVIEVPPGARSPPHRHYAQVFVYELQGSMIMQVKGGPRITISPGETFYEKPTDIHTVSANASQTEPAKFLAILIKDKGKPSTVMVGPHHAH